MLRSRIFIQEDAMKSKLLQASVFALVLSPALAFAQTAKTKPTTATYITKEELDQVGNSEQSKRGADENTKIIDLGYENFTVGVAHRSSTRTPAPAATTAANAPAAVPPAESCGRQMATLPPGGTPGGDAHEFQTEGYYIISGSGTIFTDGYIVNGRRHTNTGPGGIDGPSCVGMSYDVRKVVVKAGDVIIIPAGVLHGWVDVPDHVDYLSFRPLQNLFQAGWVNPTISK
jgi:mannose-6-phosphate isomerase-like protein (cupin superfamily)